ncbi:DUF485 domain-containing protein [Actinomadura parmotrematis]|uniref:DUF485 domain-containing protein n=1 Tax=Actinomadura parmotrematis TaxID=2864039 RepID=A0ABS7G3R5_9ACTN|nr:DUF485 domain-containing protein [Actinomadura parmotrematis]MBW8487337.1 DUF485 domain-containing protein [Actinomadura parmotrematis]
MVWDSGPPERRGSGRVRQKQARRYAALAQDERFRLLRSRFRWLAVSIVSTFLGWYLLYVLLSAFARGLMGQRVLGNINVGLILGVLQFVSTFLLAWAYTSYARKILDPLARELREEAEQAAGVPFARRAVHDAAEGAVEGARARPGSGAPAGHESGAVAEQRAREGWSGAVRPDPGWLR